ncbi:MAG TPA: hypothetical protein VGH76_26570 [Actinomycetospora sp.]|uniref:Rv1733c family protein n=1 Tax=Actinomycetospora sp. TaxID=1872135 RepID=UPI002F3E2C34
MPRPSSLRRSSDRWETAAGWTALAVLLLLVPVVLALGSARAQQVRDDAAHIRATSHQVQATVTALSERSVGEGSGVSQVVTVGWTEPDGSTHSAQRVVYDDPPAVGSPHPMWVDRSSQPTAPPSTEQDAVLQGWVADVGAFTATLVALLAGLALVRWTLDRRRLRGWDEDWLAFRRRRDRGAAG